MLSGPKRMRRTLSRFILLTVLSVGCESERVPGGAITIRNDIMDEEYNVVVIDQVSAKSGVTPFRKSLSPGDEISLPYKGVTNLRFSRKYKDFTRIYVVECPADMDKRITMKLIDVHLNRLSGGCELVKRGKQTGGFTEWEK